MRTIEPALVLALGAAFLVGCIQPPVIRVIHAPQPWQRWEYACMKPARVTGGPEEVAVEANKYGHDGWELAASDGTNWCFKRPIGSGPARVGDDP
jgi:hypothetical protein